MQAQGAGITEGVVGEVCGVEVAISMGCLHWARWAAAMTSCMPCTHVDTRKQSRAQETGCKTLGLWVYQGLVGTSHGPAAELSKLRKDSVLPTLNLAALLFSTQSPYEVLPTPPFMEHLLSTAGPPLSTAIIPSLQMRKLRWIVGDGAMSECPSWDASPGPCDSSTVFSPWGLQTPARFPEVYPGRPKPYLPSSQPTFVGLIGQRQLLRIRELLPNAPPVTGEQTNLYPQKFPGWETCQAFQRIEKLGNKVKKKEKQNICSNGKQMPDRCAPNSHYNSLMG